jgi:two-component system chemotaxis response regulator CheY
MYPLNIKVLVVDDIVAVRKMVVRGLKEIGFTEVFEAADGAQAWDMLSDPACRVSLIISDWNMPHVSGLDLLKRVRQNERLGEVAFFMLTAESEQTQVIEAIKLGINGYIIKPFTLSSLRSRLERACPSTEVADSVDES